VSVAPKKSLGQHFLVDDNILGVIARLAELGPDDVALEIGPGLGVLTRVLADRCGYVHAVEFDRRLEPHLADVAARENVGLHWGDALRVDLGRLEPRPTKLVAAIRTGLHPVSRTVFRPPPNVDSAIVAFTRISLPERFADVRRVVEGAFAHRRKTLANSLQLADVASRERAVGALESLGLDPSVRAEALPPTRFVELTEALA
jgi:16S rRNA (adenine1518-N6/adenine1519-N6)-dimethyltransferase